MSRFRVLGRSPTFWLGIGFIFSYWIWAPLLPNNTQTEYLRVFAIIYAAATVVAYTPGVWKFLTVSAPAEAQQLVMGIVTVALSGALGGIWLLLWRMAGQPAWMVNNELNGFWIWLVIVGYTLHLTAPRVINNAVPSTDWRRVWIAGFIAVATSYLVVNLRPDAHAITDFLKPYLSSASQCGAEQGMRPTHAISMPSDVHSTTTINH